MDDLVRGTWLISGNWLKRKLVRLLSWLILSFLHISLWRKQADIQHKTCVVGFNFWNIWEAKSLRMKTLWIFLLVLPKEWKWKSKQGSCPLRANQPVSANLRAKFTPASQRIGRIVVNIIYNNIQTIIFLPFLKSRLPNMWGEHAGNGCSGCVQVRTGHNFVNFVWQNQDGVA